MFNKFDQFNLNNGVDANIVKMLKYMLKLGIEWCDVKQKAGY